MRRSAKPPSAASLTAKPKIDGKRVKVRKKAHLLRDGRANHDYVAGILNATDWMYVPAPLDQELRATVMTV